MATRWRLTAATWFDSREWFKSQTITLKGSHMPTKENPNRKIKTVADYTLSPGKALILRACQSDMSSLAPEVRATDAPGEHRGREMHADCAQKIAQAQR
jgi:hypothetical protein